METGALKTLVTGNEHGGFMYRDVGDGQWYSSSSPEGTPGTVLMDPRQHAALSSRAGPLDLERGAAINWHIHTITGSASQNWLNERFGSYDMLWQKSWSAPMYMMAPTGRILHMTYNPATGHNTSVLRD